MAWVGTPAARPPDTGLLTLQAALNAAPANQTVSFDPNDYVFSTRLTVPRNVQLATTAPSTLFAQFTVSGAGLSATGDVTFGVSATGAVVTVNTAGSSIAGLKVVNPNGVLRPTGIQLAAAATGVTISDFTMDGGDQASSFGINMTTGSATITNPVISGVATGVGVTATSTAAGVSVTDGSISAALAGIGLGATTSPVVSRVSVSGGATGTGVDLANSSAATLTSVHVSGFTRSIGATLTSTAAGPSITDAVITGARSEGISLGSTTGATVTTPTVSGTDLAQSTGINLYKSDSVILDRIHVSHFATGVAANVAGTGQGPRIISPVVTDVSLGGITLGSTQGPVVTDPQVTGTGVAGSTGINTVNAGRVSVSDATIRGFGYGIGSQSSIPAGSLPRADFVLTNIDVTGVANSSTGIYLLGTTNAHITHVDADVTGPGVVVHQSSGTRVTDLRVTGHEGPSSTSGSSIFRAYDATDATVDHSTLRGGSYGFYLSSSDGVTITDAQVADVVEFGVYARSSGDVEVTDSVFTDNAGAGSFSVHPSGGGPSHDITLSDNTMTGNTLGVNLNTGTTDVTFTRNTVAGQRYAVSMAPAHDVIIAHNTVRQADSEPGEAAIMVRPLHEDAGAPGSYSSSGVVVRDNVFRGGGTWIKVGSPDDSTPDATRRTLQDAVLVVGNTFPADSVAIRTFPNALVGSEGAARAVRGAPVGPSVAVDARNYDDPNDWGSPCLPTGYRDGDLVYDGGGARIDALTVAKVLYPTNCIELALAEQMNVALSAGDTLTWTLIPRNDGLRSAPAGWTVTQLLPQGAELVSMSGAGYRFNGRVATATDALGKGRSGPRITVRVRISGGVAPGTVMKNVAYVAPLGRSHATDLDGDGYVDVIVEHRSPLVVPTLDTDTDESPTDNDAQGFWSISASGDVVPLPPSTLPPGGAHPSPGVWVPSGTPSADELSGESDGILPGTGAPAGLLTWTILGFCMVCGGVGATAWGLRRQRGGRS